MVEKGAHGMERARCAQGSLVHDFGDCVRVCEMQDLSMKVVHIEHYFSY